MISVVIPAHNEEDWIPATLESLKDQSFRGDYEILVVDNASNDDTARIASSHGVRVVYEPEKGYTKACQTGFEEAKGSIIAMTDADTVTSSSWLKSVEDSFRDERVVGAHGPCEFRDSSKYLNLLAKYGYTAFLRLNLLLGKPHLYGFNMAVRAKSFEAVSGFDLSMDSASDVDLSMRLKKVGKIVYNPEMKVRTSSRRFTKESFWRTLCYYAKNYFNVVWFRNTEKASGFEDIRN